MRKKRAKPKGKRVHVRLLPQGKPKKVRVHVRLVPQEEPKPVKVWFEVETLPREEMVLTIDRIEPDAELTRTRSVAVKLEPAVKMPRKGK